MRQMGPIRRNCPIGPIALAIRLPVWEPRSQRAPRSKETEMSKFYLGLDLGGTNVKAGVVDDTGQILHHVSVPTGSSPRDMAAGKVIARMIDAAHQVMDGSNIGRHNVAAVGVLSPGQASLTN